ncbi:NADH-quinone oxidoreductase subunit L [Poriferisphaera sp. WC338]|uniref:NADH-quinone oxidoreductase subunit L n=1 Tax=Poriferisphaera sp. WC338 TaxID=3425129 RepID=UPI003D8184A7
MIDFDYAKLIPWFPALGAVLCVLCCMKKELHKLAGPICVISILTSLVVAFGIYTQVPGVVGGDGEMAGRFLVDPFWTWIKVGDFVAPWGYFFDPLTMIMLFVITGVGSLIAWYANGYMAGDRGYARFFAGVCIFIFAMTNLVMGDNLILLYLGWEGVGLASYLLIGFYYNQPIAVEAAKKAFIVNRIGDLGFALGIFLTYLTFGSVQYADIIPAAQAILTGHAEVLTDGALAAYTTALTTNNYEIWTAWIPFLLMLGAFGKSAQIPLYVWLPDAMAGPTPVSALVHAATMVTSGVYMIARLTPIFQLSEYALPAVAIVGGVTCLYAGTIALTSNDLKGVFAYSTISQLGYMFVGVAVVSVGGVFHLLTHACFKALLFLTAGSVMHALAGNLDIRTMSGLRKKMPFTAILMFCGCVALAGLPLSAGYYSKDLLLGDAILKGMSSAPHASWYYAAGVLGIITAFVTAFYTFRLWFKVFMGPLKWEMGTDHDHEPVDDMEVITDAVAKEEEEHTGHHHHAPHEMPFFLMNLPLIPLALAALFVGLIATGMFKLFGIEFHILSVDWIAGMLEKSTEFAASHPDHSEAAHHTHVTVEIISGCLAVGGFLLAAWFHWIKRDWVAPVVNLPGIKQLCGLLVGKYYIDELYERVIRKPLNDIGHMCVKFDEIVINGFVYLIGFLPRMGGYIIKPAQSGKLQGYGVSMVIGMAVIMLLVFYAWINAPGS